MSFDEWVSALALDNPDEQWLQNDLPAPDFTDEQWHGLYWRAWDGLRFDRHYGAMGGEGFIPYRALRDYAHDNGIEGEDFALFVRFMGEIDDEWLKFQARKSDRSAETTAGSEYGKVVAASSPDANN